MATQNHVGNKLTLGMLIFLVIAVPVILFSMLGQTNWFNHASGPSGENLNSTTEKLEAVNPDGTMGPRAATGNWSNSLPSFLKGVLVFAVTDPIPDGKPTHAMPSQAQNNRHEASAAGHGENNGPQSILALTLT